jgi:hypothetical protein
MFLLECWLYLEIALFRSYQGLLILAESLHCGMPYERDNQTGAYDCPRCLITPEDGIKVLKVNEIMNGKKEIWVEEDFIKPNYGLLRYKMPRKTIDAFIRLVWDEYNPKTRRYRNVWWEDLTKIDLEG